MAEEDYIRLIFYFYLFVVALIGSMIGDRKGRKVAGFCWGFVLGPIGWLLVWLGPTIEKQALAPKVIGGPISQARTAERERLWREAQSKAPASQPGNRPKN